MVVFLVAFFAELGVGVIRSVLIVLSGALLFWTWLLLRLVDLIQLILFCLVSQSLLVDICPSNIIGVIELSITRRIHDCVTTLHKIALEGD